jgi:hypothetical protein
MEGKVHQQRLTSAIRRGQHDGEWRPMRARTGLSWAIIATLLACILGPASAQAAAPLITLSSPLTGTSTNSQAPNFSGTTNDTEDPVTLKLYAGEAATGTPVQTLTTPLPPAEGTWTIAPIEALEPGTYTALAEQTNLLTETGVSEAVTFTVDTTKPIVSLSAVSSPTNNPTPTLSGNAGTATGDSTTITVTIYHGSTTTGTVFATEHTTANAGAWSLQAAELPDGIYTAQASQQDAAGNQGTSSPTTFTIDTTKPLVSLSAVGSPTNNPTPTLSGNAGTATGDSTTITVTIYHGSTTTGTIFATEHTTANAGTWSLQTAELSDGTYTAQATQGDSAGNQGTSSATTFTVDTKSPNVKLETPAAGAFLSTQSPTFAGIAGNETGDQAFVTLDLYAGSTATGIPIQSLQITRTGSAWSTGSTGPVLPNGTYTAEVLQSDAASNTGASTPHTFTIKTDAPAVTLQGPAAVSRNATPTFSGSAETAPGDATSVKLRIYRGTSTSSNPANLAEPTLTTPVSAGNWTSGATQHLTDGTYTAQASQEDSAGNVGVSATVTFRVDTTPPSVTLTTFRSDSASGESEDVAGDAGTAAGDLPAVTVQLFAGAPIASQAPLESIMVNAVHGGWSVTFGGLTPGVYSLRAEQSDEAGNLGLSTQNSFEVTPPAPTSPTVPNTTPTVPTPSPTSTPAPLPPAAAFVWFPTAPHTGEHISLASSSTDASSPITAFAWDLAGNGAFTAAGPVTSTSFATPGNHLVRLRVTDANGLSSIVAETIVVSTPPLTLMQPFPVVRIAGQDTSGGVKLSLLTVQAPAGARVALRCRGRGCPAKSETVIAARRRKGTVTVTFGHFERSLRAGVVLEIRVTKQGQIGKYTRFAILRNLPPERTDSCLANANAKPIACPAS